MATLYKDVLLCSPEKLTFNLDFSFISVDWYAVSVDNGDLTAYQDANTLNLLTLEGTPSDTQTITFDVYDNQAQSGDPVRYEIVITVGTCSNTYDACCTSPDAIEIYWLNREGGIQNYTFTGVRTFEIRQDEAKQFIDTGYTVRYSTRGKVYAGELVNTKDIPKSHVSIMDSLRCAIQAWVKDGSEYLPILLDGGDFTRYKSTDKIFQVGFKFIYADPINIQTQ